MLKIGTVVLGVADVRRAADFWTQALHYVPREGTVEDDRPCRSIRVSTSTCTRATPPIKPPRSSGWCLSAPSAWTETSTPTTPTLWSSPIPRGTASASSTPAAEYVRL